MLVVVNCWKPSNKPAHLKDAGGGPIGGALDRLRSD